MPPPAPRASGAQLPMSSATASNLRPARSTSSSGPSDGCAAGAPRLYDIQAKGVTAAIKKGVEPPAAARITKRDWNSGIHLEQPMSEYAVTHSAEDFAESLMAWLYARDVLKARSPARFKFFDEQARRRGWLPKLVTGGAPAAPTQKRP